MRALLLCLAACGVNATPQPAPVPTLPSCIPNRDGTITADELPIALGATLDYYDSTNAAVNLVGANAIWDMSSEEASDTIVALGPVELGPQWYASQFPGSQFVVDAGGGLDGIYHQDAEALWLDGTASQTPMPAAGKTLIRYTDPAAVLRFPISDGDAFSTTAQLAGATIDGLPFIGTDQIDVDVTGSGRLDVPYTEFSPVLRVRTHVVRASGAVSVGKRTTIFLFECFGEVAHAESKQNEPDADFTTAAVLRRFALGETP
jgi:hypothetical protein